RVRAADRGSPGGAVKVEPGAADHALPVQFDEAISCRCGGLAVRFSLTLVVLNTLTVEYPHPGYLVRAQSAGCAFEDFAHASGVIPQDGRGLLNGHEIGEGIMFLLCHHRPTFESAM